jgi:nucleotide-binding universal stress UspA family protein
MTAIDFKRILCPIDFSEFSEQALRHAAAMARWYDAQLRTLFVHVNAPPVAMLPPLAETVVLPMTPDQHDQLIARMRLFGRDACAGVPGHEVVQDAPGVAREIVRQAAAWPADLVVLGTHGRSGFERLLIGSVTERVLRTATCPVLVVPRRVEQAPVPGDIAFDRILCAVDFSIASIAALGHALGMAEETSAHLTIVNAIEVPPELHEAPLSADFSVEAVRARAEAARLSHLRDLVPESARTFCTIETLVVEGKASREILRLASATQSDLIVMGVQGRGAIDLAVFGSNAQHVVREAGCPILIVHAGR